MDCRVRSQIVFCIIRFYLKEDEKRVRGSLRKEVIVRVIHPYFSSFVLQRQEKHDPSLPVEITLSCFLSVSV